MAIRVPVAGFRFYKCLIVKKIMILPVKNANPVTETGKNPALLIGKRGRSEPNVSLYGDTIHSKYFAN